MGDTEDVTLPPVPYFDCFFFTIISSKRKRAVESLVGKARAQNSLLIVEATGSNIVCNYRVENRE